MAKAKAKQSNMAMYRSFAQKVTVGAAVLYGVLWAVTGMTSTDSASLDKLSGILIAVTMVGGITMGLLYAVDSNKK